MRSEVAEWKDQKSLKPKTHPPGDRWVAARKLAFSDSSSVALVTSIPIPHPGFKKEIKLVLQLLF
jgi:hypothetical protein